MKFLSNLLMTLVTCLICIIFAEGFVRFVDGYPILALELPDYAEADKKLISGRKNSDNFVDQLSLADDVDQDWK